MTPAVPIGPMFTHLAAFLLGTVVTALALGKPTESMPRPTRAPHSPLVPDLLKTQTELRGQIASLSAQLEHAQTDATIARHGEREARRELREVRAQLDQQAMVLRGMAS